MVGDWLEAGKMEYKFERVVPNYESYLMISLRIGLWKDEWITCWGASNGLVRRKMVLPKRK